MEDQRNWTDASYKTYIRPLSKPRPFTLRAGERFAQSVELTFTGQAARPSGNATDPTTVRLGGPAGTMPRIGLFVPPDEATGSLEASDMMGHVAPQFLVAHLDLRDRRTADTLRRVQALAEALKTSITLEIVLAGTGRPGEELAEAAELTCAAGLRPEAVIASPHEYLKSWQPNETWPDVPPLEDIYDAAREAFPGSRIGGGVLAYFTELNRKRPPMAHCDFITHTTCPIVHDADDRSVMETLEALPWIAESVRAMSGGKPYRIGPSMIGMRLNPYGARPVDNPDNRRLAMAWNDPRQRGLLGAVWNFGYAARMAEAGVEALTLSAPVGAFGIAYRKALFRQPWFEAQSQCVFPVYHVVRGLAHAAGAPRLETQSSRPGAIQALAWRGGGRMILWLANLTGEPQDVTIEGLSAGAARMARLDLDRFAAAAGNPDGLATASAESPVGRQELGPYAVLRLEAGG
jgi:D-apionolactonase